MTRTVPATTLDEAFLDLRDESVLSVYLEVRVEGSVDRGRLAAALARAADAHPMARARLAPERVWSVGSVWSVDPNASRLGVSVSDEGVSASRDRLSSEVGDLAREPGVAVELVADDHGDWVLFRFHHAVIDGRGAARFVAAVADAYAGRAVRGDADELGAARDLRRLAAARGPHDVAARTMKIVSDAWRRGGLTRIAGDGGEAGPHQALAPRWLDAAAVSSIRECRPSGVSVNDVLVAAQLCAIARWNRRRGGRVGRSVSLMMPVDLRPQQDPVAVSNLASYVAVVVDTEVLSDLGSTVVAVAAQTRAVKDHRTAGWIVDVLEMGRWVPRAVTSGLPHLLPLVEPRFVESTICSNLGPAPLEDWGEAGAVRSVCFSPPNLSARMPITLGVVGWSGGFGLCWRSLRRAVSGAGLEEFADLYLDVLATYHVPAAEKVRP